MTLNLRTLLNIFILIGLSLTLGIAIYSFIKFNHYKNETEEFLKQEYWSRSQFSQTLKRLIEFQGKIREIKKEPNAHFEISRYITSLNTNIKDHILNNDTINKYFSPEDQQYLLNAQNFIEKNILPEIKNNNNTAELEKIIPTIEKYIYDISYMIAISLSKENMDANKPIDINPQFYMCILIASLLMAAILIAIFVTLQFQKRAISEERKK